MNGNTKLTLALVGTVALSLVPAAVPAQDRDGRGQAIPAGHLPLPGECRVWYSDRPPGHQPRPTSCDVARRDAARTGGRVVYGGDARRDDRDGRTKRNDRDDRDDRRRECDEKDRAEGECDWRGRERDRDDDCVDRNDDGRCDYDNGRVGGVNLPRDRYPERLPDMVWGVIFGRGDRLALEGVRQWLGGVAVRPRYVDADRNGRPEAVSWTTGRGVIVQRWIDDDRDGRADRVQLFDNGRVVRIIQQPSARGK